jgi:hypothetical protein
MVSARRRRAGWKDVGRQARLTARAETKSGVVFEAGEKVVVVRSWRGRYDLCAAGDRFISGVAKYKFVFLDPENTPAHYDAVRDTPWWPYCRVEGFRAPEEES